MADGRVRPGGVGGAGCGVGSLGRCFVLRQGIQRSLSRIDIGHSTIGSFEVVELLLSRCRIGGQGRWHVFELCCSVFRAGLKDAAHFELFGVFEQHVLLGSHFIQREAIHSLGNRHASVFY